MGFCVDAAFADFYFVRFLEIADSDDVVGDGFEDLLIGMAESVVPQEVFFSVLLVVLCASCMGAR